MADIRSSPDRRLPPERLAPIRPPGIAAVTKYPSRRGRRLPPERLAPIRPPGIAAVTKYPSRRGRRLPPEPKIVSTEGEAGRRSAGCVRSMAGDAGRPKIVSTEGEAGRRSAGCVRSMAGDAGRPKIVSTPAAVVGPSSFLFPSNMENGGPTLVSSVQQPSLAPPVSYFLRTWKTAARPWSPASSSRRWPMRPSRTGRMRY